MQFKIFQETTCTYIYLKSAILAKATALPLFCEKNNYFPDKVSHFSQIYVYLLTLEIASLAP